MLDPLSDAARVAFIFYRGHALRPTDERAEVEFVTSLHQDVADLSVADGAADGARIHSEQTGSFGDRNAHCGFFRSFHATNVTRQSFFVNNSVDKRREFWIFRFFPPFLPLIPEAFDGNLLSLNCSVDTH